MHSLGVGTTHDMTSVLRGVVWPSLASPHYTPGEKVRLWRGKRSGGVAALWDEMLTVDLTERVTRLPFPAYFFHGVYDYTVNYQLAKDYVEALKAPLKGLPRVEPVRSQPRHGRAEKDPENHARGCTGRDEQSR